MTTVVRVQVKTSSDPLARDEKEIRERLRAMARDALQGKDEPAVEAEIEIAARVLGLSAR